MGTGKTHGAFDAAMRRKAPFLFYTPLQGYIYERGGHPLLKGVKRIPVDAPRAYAQGFGWYFKQARGFYITAGDTSEHFFRAARTLQGCSLVIDDLAAVLQEPEEVSELQRLIPRLKWCGVETTITAHLITEDVPRKIRVAVDEIYWHGPLDDEDEARILYKRRRLNIPFNEYIERLKAQKQRDILRIR
jgi:hypothetical protein